MKVVICFILCAATALAGPVKPVRRYVEAENNPDARRFIYVENSLGEPELVDLTQGEIQSAALSDVTYYLYTQKNLDTPYTIFDGDVSDLELSPFDSSKTSLFVIHGWNNNRNSKVNTLIREAVLGRFDVNVFVVDWSTPANSFYLSAKAAVVPVGEFLGEFINGIQEKYGLTGSSFVLVGHSLGAHVAGNAGAAIRNKVDHIVGLDPAAPLFSLGNTENRLDETDANFVQVIHTNGLLLGFASSIGHADYFPNGGMTQPGCGIDITGTCAHSRSYQYFAESLSRGRVFQSTLCDSYKNFENSMCAENRKSPMGLLKIDKSAEGDFYLDTNSAAPFGLD